MGILLKQQSASGIDKETDKLHDYKISDIEECNLYLCWIFEERWSLVYFKN